MLTDALIRTAPLYERVRHIIPSIEWPLFAEDIDAILELKRKRNAVILAHNYQTPEIFHCVADIVGDSLKLARQAMTVEAEVIVLAGVHFMAETAKLLNPAKTVLIPDGLLARRVDHAGRRASAAQALPRRADCNLCEYVRRSEGRVEHLLHVQ
jgi:quinolinate synthase